MSITEEERNILIEHRINKAYQTYDDALFAFQAGRYSNSANRLYYSLFHACGALLLSIGKEANRHSGMRAMISLYFIKNGILQKKDSDVIHEMFIIRQQCDYDDFVEISKEKIEDYLGPVKDLIDRVTTILNITPND